MNTIHIYGQKSFHENVWIVTDREGMEKLNLAIIEALVTNEEVVLETSVNDGDGYTIHMKIDSRVDSCSSEGKYAVPYYADYACEKREDAIYPWSTTEGYKK